MKADLYKNRVKKARKLCRDKTISSLVLTDAADIRYLSGFAGDDSWLVLTPRQCVLVTDSRYTTQAKKQCSACKIVERKGPITKAVAEILNKTSANGTIGIDENVSVRVFAALKKELLSKLKTAGSPLESLREIKDAAEVRAIITAGKIASDVLAKILPQIKYQMTENHIAGLLDFEIRKANSTNSFETIVAFGPNAAMAHHRPSNRKLKKNDSILIDFGAVYNGYCSDITRCFTFGKMSRFYADVYKAVFDAQSAAIAQVKDGAKIADVETAAKDVLKKANLPLYGHSTGHGLGLKVHESPAVAAVVKSRLKVGQTITIEPGVYIEGRFGIRIEDDILVTPTGAKILTKRLPTSDLLTINTR
ncbi:MAG: Xaa-Pro peptidase family protein [Anaerohalosphaeraceae bacterium]|nr:Xaa-Pro peptidase family protein [Anaerohalosphaeraceae bacterium]